MLMSINWILILVMFLVITSGLFIKNRDRFHKMKFSGTSLLGILIPLLFAFFWGSNLIKIFPELTFIDLAVGLLLGMISGFFVAMYFINKSPH